MNLSAYELNEEFLEDFEDITEEKPEIRKFKKEEKYSRKVKQDKGKLREIKRNQENDYE